MGFVKLKDEYILSAKTTEGKLFSKTFHLKVTTPSQLKLRDKGNENIRYKNFIFTFRLINPSSAQSNLKLL